MRILTVLLLFAVLVACNNNAKNDVANKPETKSESDSKIVRNDVDFTTTGSVTVKQAFLTFDDGSLVGNDNKMNIGQRVTLHLILDGWKTNADGKVMLAASEKITTNEGQVVLAKDDLFDQYADGLSEADSRIITLSAVITAAYKQFKYFEVSFRVLDKTSGDNVTGSYKLYPRG